MEVQVPGPFRSHRGGDLRRSIVWLVNGEKVTVTERVDVVASALTRKPCMLVPLPLDDRGLEVVYVNGDQVTHVAPAEESSEAEPLGGGGAPVPVTVTQTGA